MQIITQHLELDWTILYCYLCKLKIVEYQHFHLIQLNSSMIMIVSFLFYFIFEYILLIMLLQVSHFSFPIIPLCPVPSPPAFPHFSSCPWVIHTSSLASTFPILFLTSPCLFCTYYLCFLILVEYNCNLPTLINKVSRKQIKVINF